MTFLLRLVYHFKTNVIRYLAFLFSLVFFVLAFYFCLPTIVKDKSNYDLYTSCNVNQVWFASSSTEEDCFFNLNGELFIYSGEKSINADILMQTEEGIYQNNPYQITSQLGHNECIVSRNLAQEYHLDKGDVLTLKNGLPEFTIVSFFTSQSGIDDKYNHEGAVVLSYEEEVIQGRETNFLFYAYDGDGFFNVDRAIFLKDTIEHYRQNVITNCLKLGLFSLGIILLEELFIFSFRQEDYRIYRKDGIKNGKLIFKIALDNVIRYFLPALIANLIFIQQLLLFERGYLFFFITDLCFLSLIILMLTVLYFIRRISHGKKFNR